MLSLVFIGWGAILCPASVSCLVKGKVFLNVYADISYYFALGSRPQKEHLVRETFGRHLFYSILRGWFLELKVAGIQEVIGSAHREA